MLTWFEQNCKFQTPPLYDGLNHPLEKETYENLFILFQLVLSRL